MCLPGRAGVSLSLFLSPLYSIIYIDIDNYAYLLHLYIYTYLGGLVVSGERVLLRGRTHARCTDDRGGTKATAPSQKIQWRRKIRTVCSMCDDRLGGGLRRHKEGGSHIGPPAGLGRQMSSKSSFFDGGIIHSAEASAA